MIAHILIMRHLGFKMLVKMVHILIHHLPVILMRITPSWESNSPLVILYPIGYSGIIPIKELKIKTREDSCIRMILASLLFRLLLEIE